MVSVQALIKSLKFSSPSFASVPCSSLYEMNRNSSPGFLFCLLFCYQTRKSGAVRAAAGFLCGRFATRLVGYSTAVCCMYWWIQYKCVVCTAECSTKLSCVYCWIQYITVQQFCVVYKTLYSTVYFLGRITPSKRNCTRFQVEQTKNLRHI